MYNMVVFLGIEDINMHGLKKTCRTLSLSTFCHCTDCFFICCSIEKRSSLGGKSNTNTRTSDADRAGCEMYI